MSNRIEKLTLCYFRGGTCPVEIEFDRTKPVAVIFGENGDGKSTIVDAIGTSLRGEVGSLKLVSLPAAKTKYLASIGVAPSDMLVSATVGGNTWTTRLSKTGLQVTGPTPSPPVHILRRAEVLKLVTSEPKDRYGVLRSLIAVDNIEEAAKQLRQAVKDAESAVELAVERRAESEKILNDLWVDRGKPATTSALAWARAEVAADLNTLTAEITAAKQFRDSAARASETWSRSQAASVLAGEAQILLHNKRSQVEEAEAAEEALLVDVLEAAQRALSTEADVCPVCEQAISARDVQVRVSARLTALKGLRDRKSEIVAAEKVAEAKAAVAAEQRQMFEACLITLASNGAAVRGQFPSIPSAPDVAVAGAEQENYLSKVVDMQNDLADTIAAKEAKLHQHNLIATNLRAVDESVEALAAFQKKSKRLQVISGVVEGLRKKYVNDVLNEISGGAAAMYAKIHPGEPIGNVSLFLKETAAGSLELSGVFASEKAVPPQAYYSESHLDTLGVCVFLAMAERDKDAVVVLDDVFTSVDDAHLARIIELLHDEANNLGHLVITTHYRAWRDRYKYARGPAANAQLIELLPWARGHGIRHARMKVSAEELRNALATEPVDRIGVAARAGVLLEALLDDLTLRYKCRMPRRVEAEYTLGDLLTGLDSKLLKRMRVIRETSEAAVEPLIQKLAAMTFLRNQVGCHFNLAGSNISDKDVRIFGATTLELASTLICEYCGELPRRDKTGEYLQCSCGQTKLAPHVKPGDNPE